MSQTVRDRLARGVLLTGFVIVAVSVAILGGLDPRSTSAAPSTPSSTRRVAALTISGASDNQGSYPGSQVPRYEKLEITFRVDNSVASNLYQPYDETPPPGVTPKVGITVNAEFSQDRFRTVYTQPAFYYQEFDYQVKAGKEWIYPKDSFTWKARFAPNQEGSWQYRLRAQDASGSTVTKAQRFTVGPSASHGFVRASPTDSRYFEFEDGTYFPGLGYNMNWDHISWDRPVLGNEANFQEMNESGVQLVRAWLSQWSIFGSYDNPWRSPVRGSEYDSLTTTDVGGVRAGSDASMYLKWSVDTSVWQGSPCMFLGWLKAAPAVKPNTSYHVAIRYRLPRDLPGPAISGQPYGLVAKLGGWLTGSKTDPSAPWRKDQECAYPAALTNQQTPGLRVRPVTPYAFTSTAEWSTLEGDFVTDAATTGGGDFLPFFYLALENVGSVAPDPTAYIDYVEIRENLGGALGPNVVSKPSMSQLEYVDQHYAYAFDRVLELADQYDVYLKLVVLEKNEFIQNSLNYLGSPVPYDSSNKYFYGNWREPTKVRWLQQSWWRYLQARWGYSTSVHSWELLNEGDPYNGLHYTLADEFAKYMHRFAPNGHLVTTSFWHSFPLDQFWRNPSYPNVDYADVHRYIPKDKDQAAFDDSALATEGLSAQVGAKTSGGAGKPTMRGETGFVDTGSGPPSAAVASDVQGIWLHKYVWAGLNSGGLLESYWYENAHIYTSTFDHRGIFRAYYDFVKDIPLSSGRYVDLQPTVSNANLRVLGQKDPTSGSAHLWIDNRTHTWSNVVSNRAAVAAQGGTVGISGLPPGSYTVTWYDTYSGAVSRVESRVIDSSCSLSLDVAGLETDVAVKVTRDPGQPLPTPSPTAAPTATPKPTATPMATPTPFSSPALVTADWPQVQGNPQHTGLRETLGTTFKVKWTYPFQPERVHPQVQAIVYGGAVFVGTEMGNLYAVDASTGAKRWSFKAGGPILNSAAAEDGRVVFASLDGAVYALGTADGRLIWKQQLSSRLGFSAAPLLAEGKVLVGGQDGYFYALDAATGNVLWKYRVGAPLLQTAAYDAGRTFFGAMDLRVYALNTADGSLAWRTAEPLPGTAFKDYWPVAYQGKVFVIPMARTVNAGLTPGFPFSWFDSATAWSWLAQYGPLIAQGKLSSVVDAMAAQDAALARYQSSPASYSKNLFILDQATGQETTVVPHWSVQTMNGATAPPCVDRDGRLVVPAMFGRSGWARLDLTIGRITDVLYDGLDRAGNPVPVSGGNPAGMGNDDETLAVTCTANLVIAMHNQEANANYTGAFDLDRRRWTLIPAGQRNAQMSSNTQGGGVNPASVAGGLIYHISTHELIARTTQ